MSSQVPNHHRCRMCNRFFNPTNGHRLDGGKPSGVYNVTDGICIKCYRADMAQQATVNCELIKARTTVRATAVARGVTICLCLAALLCGCDRSATWTEGRPVEVTWITNGSTVVTRGDTGFTNNELTAQTVWITNVTSTGIPFGATRVFWVTNELDPWLTMSGPPNLDESQWFPSNTVIFCKFEPVVTKTNGGWNIAFKP